MTTLYGINNCDTVKKAQKWLNNQNISYIMHNYKTDGLSKALLEQFVQYSDWSSLLNKRSTTYRQLPDAIKENLEGELLITTVLQQPTLLKRPILMGDNIFHIGFKPEQYQELFGHDS